MNIRVVVLAAKVAIFSLMLGSVAMALLAQEAGPWIFGVFPATVVLGTVVIAVSRSMKLRAAMRAANEDPHVQSPGKNN